MAADNRGRHGGRDDRGGDGLTETVVKINRCAKVMKGGRRFSFSALVVVGDQAGQVGFGFGKANDVPTSVEKGVKEGRKAIRPVALAGATIPHRVVGRFGAAKVIMIPASPGTGVIAGASVRAVVEAAGIKDVLTKSIGSANPVNLVKATMAGLDELRTREQVEALRGVSLSEG